MRFKEEINESYTMAEAIAEAQRCLHCKVPQCQKGCPISNDIPDWIHELKKGNLGNAISIIRAKSNLPAVCGRVCGHEKQCEGACVLGKKGEAIHIGKLERFVADFDSENNLTHEDVSEKTRGKVAVIGAGPSGITVAGDLSRMGFAVEVFEMEAQCGGVLRYGIPEYRLPKEVVAREIRYIEKMGVIIHRNTHVGVEITVDGLFSQGFDAIFIGTGLSKPKSLEIPIWQNGKCISDGESAVKCADLKKIRMTTRKGVFAGGDVANRQATVVHAMQDAKKVALGIAQYVDAVRLMAAIK